MIENVYLGQRIIFDSSPDIRHDSLVLNNLVGTVIRTYDNDGSCTICFDRNDLRTIHGDNLHQDYFLERIEYIDVLNLEDYVSGKSQTRCWNIGEYLVKEHASELVISKDGIVYD